MKILRSQGREGITVKKKVSLRGMQSISRAMHGDMSCLKEIDKLAT